MSNVRTFPSSGYNPRSVVTATVDRRVTDAKKRFVKWLNRKHPDVLNRAIREEKLSREAFGLSGFGQTDDETAWYDKVINGVTKILPVWAGIEQQKELIKINERRAQQGLDPVNTAQFEVEAGEATRAEIGTAVKEGFGQYKVPIYIGVGLLAAKMLKVI